jgi:hypothetical protein
MASITQDVKNFLLANPNLSDTQIASLMDQYSVAPDVVALATNRPLSEIQSRYDAVTNNAGVFANYVPPRPTFDTIFTNWNESHKQRFGTYVNLATTGQENVTTQIAELNKELQNRQAEWDKTYGNTPQATLIKNDPPPTWGNVYATWAQKYKQVFGQEFLDRPWSSDAEAVRQKQDLDSAYLQSLADYNARNNTNIQPDPSVLGTNVQPNAIFKVPETKRPSFLESIAPFALMAIPGMQGIAATIGTTLGATGAAATAIGTGIITGTATGLITGDEKQAIINGITAGAGNYFVASGAAGSLLDAVGLGDVATNLNLPTGTTEAARSLLDTTQAGTSIATEGLLDVPTLVTPPAEQIVTPIAPPPVSAPPSIVVPPPTDYSLLSNANIPATIPEMGASGVIPGSGGIGLQAPTMPNIAAMGGGQGLTVPVVGGTVGAMGLTPTGAVPVLGSPSSIINQPEVLGQPVMAQGSPTSPISPTDVLRASNALQQLTQQPQPQAPQTPEQTGQSGPLGVDYSQLLSLLASQANTTGLLGTRFQPTSVNLSSLLG